MEQPAHAGFFNHQEVLPQTAANWCDWRASRPSTTMCRPPGPLWTWPCSTSCWARTARPVRLWGSGEDHWPRAHQLCAHGRQLDRVSILLRSAHPVGIDCTSSLPMVGKDG